MAIIEVAGLTKSYRDKQVVRGIDLEIAEDVVTTWSRSVVRELVPDDHFDAADDAIEADGEVVDAPIVDAPEAVTAEETAADTERRLNKD